MKKAVQLLLWIWINKTNWVNDWWESPTFTELSVLVSITRDWNTGLVSSLMSWGEGASLALVGDTSSDGVTIKMPYGVDV